MCGRFAITLPPEAVRAFFDYVERPNFPPRYNIAPTQPIPIVYAREHSHGAERHFLLVRWGFLPGFVKDAKDFPLLINARAETLGQKPSFRAALKRRRCLVISDGFYEWRRTSATGPKQPFLIRRVNGEPMALAGLYETWSGSERGRDRYRLHHHHRGEPADVAGSRPDAGDPAARGVFTLARRRRRRRAERRQAARAGAGERIGVDSDRDGRQPRWK